MKKFILGLIIGLMLPATVAFASDYTVVQNQFPVYVDGTQQNVEALNINGTTWLRLGSIGSVLDVDVTFDEVNKKIDIKTESTETTLTSGGDAEVSTNEKTSDGINIHAQNNIKYVRFNDVYVKYGITFGITNQENKTVALKKNDEIILNDMQYVVFGGFTCLDADYYENTILPLIQ